MYHGCGSIHAVCTAELDKLSVKETPREFRCAMAEAAEILSTKSPNSLDGEMQSAARYR